MAVMVVVACSTGVSLLVMMQLLQRDSAHLANHCVAAEEACNDVVEEVVEGVVPGCNDAKDAQWVILHASALVGQQEHVHRALLG